MSRFRPNFIRAWSFFSEINVSVKEVGEKIGGHVQINIDSGVFQNACPIRMSYVLNKCGILIPNGGKYAVVSGNDKKQYMYRVNDMILYLEDTFGKPDLIINSPKQTDFNDKKGIVVFSGSGWSNAGGHVTLWNGNICSDSCHFMNSENGSFTPEKGLFWSLT
ncbi:type VI secretion system amidase effector protein Tae4 [Psychromonas antarctica]|uniref:type VI secretion system amidase effector protein Tae4 n=1 Tax=Psychromonas antarctica TaxID=67573 RepID=UPI001EE7FDE5|nr:type VI secretion system amidase effector protein Tae4 [Psychromonas antarctica]MCG6201201.1 type VI secretion system amidase effector protein Tae4 [Psychromonas antarctica]